MTEVAGLALDYGGGYGGFGQGPRMLTAQLGLLSEGPVCGGNRRGRTQSPPHRKRKLHPRRARCRLCAGKPRRRRGACRGGRAPPRPRVRPAGVREQITASERPPTARRVAT